MIWRVILMWLLGVSLGWADISDAGVSRFFSAFRGASFFYASTVDTSLGYPDCFSAVSTLVREPGGGGQLFAYVHDASSFVEATNKTPKITGLAFDNGVDGGVGSPLYYRDSFHWGRKQFADIHFPVTTVSDVQFFTAADYRKATMSHWLLAADGVSVAGEISSVREASPDADGSTNQWTWYSYGYQTPQYVEWSSQVAAIGQVLPDGTSQYTRYSYPIFPTSPWVSENDQSYSKPDGTIGEVADKFTYAANGIDLISESNSLGQFRRMSYNASHEITLLTNALGQVTSFGYGDGTLTSIVFPSGATNTFTYNIASSNPPATLNFLSAVTNQPENRVTKVSSWVNGLPQNVQVAGPGMPDLYFTNSWDGLNRLTGIAYQDGTTISNVYLALDLVRHKDRAGNWTSYTYDGLDHLVGLTNALGNSMSFGWCGCGSLTSVTNFIASEVTRFTVDNQGRVTTVVLPDGSSYTNQFDLAGRLVTRTDGAGKSRFFKYNNQDLVTNVSDGYGSELSVVYDPLNRPTNVVDVNGVVTTNGYDLLGELTAHGYGTGEPESYTWASNGLVRFVNLDGQATSFGRDAAGRLTSVTNALGQTAGLVYNALDEVMGLTDGNGHATQWGYNQWGWLTSKTNAHGTTVAQYAYDGDGRVTNRSLAGVSTGYSYDAVGNLKATAYAGTSNSFSYDADNRMTGISNGFGAETLGYTGSGQLQSVSGSWGSLSYSYNQGRRASLTLGAWAQSYGYDNAWRLTGVASPAGAFAYGYGATASPLPTGLQLPNGAAVSYGYDALARLTNTALASYWGQVIDGEGCGRDLLGLPTNVVRWLGLSSNAASVIYDGASQLIGWSASENGTNRLNEQIKYQYDGAGNLIARTNNALVQSFSINPLNEISTATRSGTFTLAGSFPEPASKITVNGTTATQYGDLTFAATGLSLANGSNPFTVAATNKYGAATNYSFTANLPTTVSFQCDTNGNLTSDGALSYQYDAENELTNVYLAGQWQVGFIYDAIGRRRAEQDYTWTGSAWSKTNEVHFVYDGLVPVEELNSNDTQVLVTYTRGLDLSLSLSGAGGIGGLLARTDASSNSAFYHNDLNGNVTALADQSQHVLARYEYDPYGRLLGQWGPYATLNRYGFSGKERVAQAGLYYYGARFYHPNLQRWLNQDPIGIAGGANLYGFVGNGPLNKVDGFGFDYHYYGNPADFPPGMSPLVYGDTPFEQAISGSANLVTGFENGMTALGDIADWAWDKSGAHDVLGGEPTDFANAMAGEFGGRMPEFESPDEPIKPQQSCPPKKPAYLYQKVDAAGEHLKFGVTQNPLKRYTQAELAGGKLNILAEGPKSEMLELERDLHGTLPIGPEEGQKFYIQQQIDRGLRPPPYY